MRFKTIHIIAALTFIVLLAPASLGQQQKQQPTPDQSKSPDYVDFTGFRGKIFEIKHRNPSELVVILNPLSSGFKGAMIVPHDGTKTISVWDFPENIATIEEAIKRLDVPTPPKAPRERDPNLEIRMYLMIASNKEGASNQYPDDLKDVLKQLQSALNYQNYYLLTPIVQRVYAPSGASGEGVVTVSEPLFERAIDAKYSYSIGQFRPEAPFVETRSLLLDGFDFRVSASKPSDAVVLGSARISNRLTIRDGEKVVLGTASLRDKALIVVLSVKVVP